MPNRLAQETSAYLLQHANNPVNWYPWCEEAFLDAKNRNVPVLLSIGYSTCHWCHVMEHESFENPDIAKVMNENYVCIKVDREERPDIDSIYMKVVQAMTGAGGWPMTLWLTPDKKPFFAGTYFPPFDGSRGANVGFYRILQILKERFDVEKDRVTSTSEEILKYLQEQVKTVQSIELPNEKVIDNAHSRYQSEYDRENGGTLGGPKFPSTLPLLFLLRLGHVEMVENTLTKMARRGLYDHIDGGFHRYCVDEAWTIPHFEKMLYDNALLARSCLETYLVTKKDYYKEVLIDILTYLEKEMLSPDGVFFAATDADSLNTDGEKEEGAFFVWTPAELQRVLSVEEIETMRKIFEMEELNFEGKYIHLVRSGNDSNWDPIRKKLKAYRDARPKPLRDEKVLVAWNALAISAFARAGMALKNPRYLGVAEKATDFILKNLYRDGRLYRSYQVGNAKGDGVLEDYSYFISALLDLFSGTGSPEYFQIINDLNKYLDIHFKDKNGGYYHSTDEAKDVILRDKPYYDGAEPSGNSVQFQNLMRLYSLTTDEKFLSDAEGILRILKDQIEKFPTSLGYLMNFLIDYFSPPNDIVVVSDQKINLSRSVSNFFENYKFGSQLYFVSSQNVVVLAKMNALLFLGKTSSEKDAERTYTCTRGACVLTYV
ncbi:MAG: hypothetical protein A4S09_03490 [Proteobacteria bacterium SG_bin7]|nr:MAG: hypothetical protein A4S09_03490 [Proteobacteria bacterium SG_bin7]